MTSCEVEPFTYFLLILGNSHSSQLRPRSLWKFTESVHRWISSTRDELHQPRGTDNSDQERHIRCRASSTRSRVFETEESRVLRVDDSPTTHIDKWKPHKRPFDLKRNVTFSCNFTHKKLSNVTGWRQLSFSRLI
jgi:hypothetical protein